ncbi:MAG: hypothetical protein CM1200mP14_12430 [Gammaproteobacteria bacterium]|nr:MAG: hypothetical protein CM1200mP14_12430 [Gammaproteobacteria bacterium]
MLKGEGRDELTERVNAVLFGPRRFLKVSGPLVLDPGLRTTMKTKNPDANGHGLASDRVLSEKGPLRWSRTRRDSLCRLPCSTRHPQHFVNRVGKEDGKLTKKAMAKLTMGNEGPTIVQMATRVSGDGRPLGPEEVSGGVCPEFIADVDIWHVGDERKPVDPGVARECGPQPNTHWSYPIEGGGELRFVQLADETMETIQISEDGHSAVGADDREYRSDWRPNYQDLYLVDVETGERTLISSSNFERWVSTLVVNTFSIGKTGHLELRPRRVLNTATSQRMHRSTLRTNCSIASARNRRMVLPGGLRTGMQS